MRQAFRSGSSMDAATEMLYVIDRFQRSSGRASLPPNSLALDFPQRRALGFLALDLTKKNGTEALGIMSDSEEALARIAAIGEGTPRRLADIGLVLVNYILHDVPEMDRPDFLRRLSALCPSAAILVADYTMRDLTGEEADELFTADLERNRMAEKTREVYLREHMQFTYVSLHALMVGQHACVRGHELPGGRALMMGHHSDALWTPDLEHDWHAEASPIAANIMSRSTGTTELLNSGIAT